MTDTVLVVDDEADIRLMYRIVLQTAGYEVIEASTGEDALSILDQTVPDAMILDLWLPGIDGWDVLALLRLSGALSDTPIFIASANAQPGQQARADELGCAEMFTKPFSAEKLRDSLTRVLATR
jgi:CheY-like chemotaxis protein